MFRKTRSRPRFAVAFAAVALAAASLSVPVAAEETLEEIVVVADFRDRAAAELSPSVAVLDSERLRDTAVQHFEELILSVPNLNWSGDGNRARYLQIRGIGELEQYEGAPNPSVGFLVDDIDFSGIGTIATLFDVEQIDVLRGPQGTRYGANALAGLVYVQSREPGDDWEGRVRLSAGGDDLRSGGLAVGGPLVDDRLAFRVAAHHHESDGFRDNPFLGRDDTNGRRESTLRGKLRWTPGEDWLLRLSTLYVDIDDGYDAFAVDNSLTVLSDRPGEDAQRSLGAALRAEWSGSDAWSLTSITTAADSTIDFSFDADWGNPDAWAPYTYDFISVNNRSRRTVSQEFRFMSEDDGRLFDDSTDWLFGFYAMQLEDGLRTLNRGDYVDPFFNFALAIDDAFASDFEALTLAAFGELEIAVSARGTLTTGLRVERRDSDYRDSAGLAVTPAETMLGGELRYRHELDDDLSLYAGLSRGYKAGGFNLGVVPDDRREFEREVLWNLEAGLRAGWLDGALTLDAVLFYNRREDQQVRTSFQLVPNDPASFVFFTDNAASGRSIGLESTLRYEPHEAWQWYASVGLLRAEFDDFVTPQVDLSGRDQAHAPRYMVSAGVKWQHPAGWFLRTDLSAQDAFYFDVSHDQRSAPREIIGLRGGYASNDWHVELWARNLLDERYAVRGFFFGNEPPDFPPTLYTRQGDPRQLGITIERRFQP